MKNILSIKNLIDKRIAITLIQPLSFEVKEGECVAFIGNNGAGKTTLLKIIAGLATAEVGEVEVDQLFYCGHETGLKTSLSVKDNLTFRSAIFQGTVKKDIQEALSYFALEKTLDRAIGTLSQGQKKLIALTSALLCPYPLWILDEPLANLDKEAQIRFEKLIKEEKQKGKAIIFTAHADVTHLADFVVSL